MDGSEIIMLAYGIIAETSRGRPVLLLYNGIP